MLHIQWIDQMKETLEAIEQQYPQSSGHEQEQWKRRTLQIKQACDQLLKSWASVEAQLGKLAKKYPELLGQEEIDEEAFFLEESAVRQFRRGQGYYQLTMFDEASHFFQQVVSEEPDFVLGRLYLGLSTFQQGALDQAEQHFRWITHTTTEELFVGFAYHMLGCIHVRLARDEQAIRYFERALSYLPNSADAWFNIGACYYRLQDHQKAIPAFYQALSFDEDDWEAMYYLSNCYRHSCEWANVSFWRLASFEKQHHPQIIESIAHDYEEMGNCAEALQWYHRLLAEDRKSAAAYYGVSWNLWVLERKKEARLWLKKGLTLDATHQGLLSLYLWMLLQDGKVNELQQTIDRFPDDFQQRPAWLAIRSRLFSRQGDTQQALTITDRLIEQANPMVQALGYYQRGRILLEDQKSSEAIHDFQQAHHLASTWKEPIFFEGVCHMLEGKHEETKDCWNKIMIHEMNH